MAKWDAAYWSLVNCDLDDPDAGAEVLRLRIFPKGEPERWIAEINPDLPREVQEDFASLLADLLSNFLGV